MRTSKWAILAYVAITLFGIIAALPNVLPASVQQQYASFLPVKPVTLGLDLKGGSHLVLEVDAAGLRQARLNTLLDDIRGALRHRASSDVLGPHCRRFHCRQDSRTG